MTVNSALPRIEVDFNTLNSAPADLVKIAAPGSWQEQRLPPLCQGQRVQLFDAEGLKVEATIIHDEQGWWLAAPDGATWHDPILPLTLLSPRLINNALVPPASHLSDHRCPARSVCCITIWSG